jgi:hypothetical protein
MADRYYVINKGDISELWDSETRELLKVGKYDFLYSGAQEANRQASPLYDQSTTNLPKAAQNKQSDNGLPAGSTSAPTSNTKNPTTKTPTQSGSAGQKRNSANTNQKNSQGTSAEQAGRRPFNPLSKLSSYTYNISLLMVNPEAYNIYAATGGRLQKTVPGAGGKQVPGYYVVAQSGGINANEYRAITLNNEPGKAPGLDFFIDDLVITSYMASADGTNTPTNEAGLNFKIIEPYGFNFVQSLTDASNKLNSESQMIARSGDEVTAYQQIYLIAIRFYGYDVNGKLVTTRDLPSTDVLGGELSIENSTDGTALFERFFSIQITDITFKLDGKTIVYNVESLALPLQTAFSLKCGLITKPTEIYASTVEQALGSDANSSAFFTVEGAANAGDQRENPVNAEQQRLRLAQSAPGSGTSYKPAQSAGSGRKGGLMQILNQQLLDEVDLKQRSRAGQYLIQYDPTASNIKNSRLVNKDPNQSGTNNGAKTADINARASSQAQNKNSSTVRISLSEGTPIIQAIEEIISQSSYVDDALKQVNDSNLKATQTEKDSKIKLKWFHINPIVKVIDRDKKLNDWVWDICYQIRSYDIPYIRSTYKTATDDYYGPTKRYEYWLTGLNTEVLEYTQQFDALYFAVTSLSSNLDRAGENTGQGATVSSRPLGGSYGSTGGPKTNRGGQTEQNVKGALYGASTADQAQAKIRIVGDPDWLMSPLTASESLERLASKRYAKDDSIDPNGGQIFIELNFNTAQDYSQKNTGLLDVNRNINFYPTDILKKKGIQGLVYQVTTCESTFTRGRFEQVLDLLLIDETTLFPNEVDKTDAKRETTTNTNSAARTPSAVIPPAIKPPIANSTGNSVSVQTPPPAPTIPPTKSTAQDDAWPATYTFGA